MELLEEGTLDALASLVVWPELVPERLDHVVGRHAEVRRTTLDHLEHGVQHARDGAEWLVLALVEAALAVEVAEELVGTVDEMDDHAELAADREQCCERERPPAVRLFPVGSSLLEEQRHGGTDGIGRDSSLPPERQLLQLPSQ